MIKRLPMIGLMPAIGLMIGGTVAMAVMCDALVPASVVAADSEAETPAESPALAAARRQAEALHEAMHATLRIVHHQYFREDEGLAIPAEILKGVFNEVEEHQGIKLRWLVVDGQAMNTDHKPQDAFETAAVRALKKGAVAHEAVADGVYRRAGAITLSNECLKCHVPRRSSNDDQTAGLLISIPLRP